MRLPVALVAAASLTALAVPNAAHALTWNFSFVSNNPAYNASGTFVTDGASVAVGQVYTITSVAGTQNGSTITGLANYFGADNTFKWNGSPSSLLANSYGIAWDLASGSFSNAYCSSGGSATYCTADSILSDTGIELITSSTLSVYTAPAPVPGPLPLFGAGAAFGWSRRLRRRVKSGSLKATPLSTTTAIYSVLPPLS